MIKIYIFALLYQYIFSLIVLPFKINGYKLKDNKKINITDYIDKYLIVDIFTTIEIGSPPQKVTTLISPEENTFSLSSDICQKESLDYISDYSIVSKKGLNLDNLKSYNNEFSNSNFKNYIDEHKNIGTISESIFLFNTTFLSSQPLDWKNQHGNLDNKIKIDNFTMIIKDYKNGEKLCGRIGIGSPTLLTGGILKLRNMTSFFDILKKNKIINNYSWTIKLYHKEEGRLIIGGLPHEYEDSNFVVEKNYKIINSFWPNDVDFPWSIRFDSINFINSKNETIYIQQGLRSLLAPNLGFIIGEENYKKLILENYFKELINKKICILEKTSNTQFNRSKYIFGTNGIYEMFHCNQSLFNEKESFPKINFEFKEQNLVFSLSFYDLFQLIEERYFFLVIFPENYYNVKHSFWYLGLPFYKAYQFVFNFDSKTIGVYYQQLKINKDIEKKENEKITINKETKNSRYKRTLLEILFGIFLVVIAYIIGKKINEQRKKRANELIDDYEYYSNSKKDINDSKNDSSDIKNNKGNFEMSSSIGI